MVSLSTRRPTPPLTVSGAGREGGVRMAGVPYSIIFDTLETIIREAEHAQENGERETAGDALSQAWGICRVFSLQIARNGYPALPDHQRFSELEARRKNVNAWLYGGF